MEKELIKELSIAQEKLKVIDRLSNSLQSVNSKQKDEISYLIHRIIDSAYYNSSLANEVLAWSLESKKDLFIKVKDCN